MIFKFWMAISSLVLAMACLSSNALAQSQEPVLPLPAYAPSDIEATPVTSLHGGLYLWYYRPQQSWVDEDFSVYYTYLTVDTTYEDFGVRLEGRFRDTYFADYYASNVWFQEAYGYYRQPNYIVKVGKTYSRFGRFWDGSIYGNVLSFDGLKLSPDSGFSFEGQFADYRNISTNYVFQYFIQDGSTNNSLDGLHSGTTTSYSGITGRDTLTISGGRRRNEIIARVEPTIKFVDSEFTIGANYMYLLADLTTLPPPPNAPNINPGRFNVHRYAFDLSYKRGPFSIFYEYDHQHGRTVIDYPNVGEPSSNIKYYWAGINYKTGKWTFYYNYSEGLYQPQNLHNITQVPGFVYQFRKYIQLIFEYGYMYRTQTGGFYGNDNSLNFILKANI